MNIRKFHMYLADLNPRFGTEPGKTRPVVVVQTDLLNAVHPSTIVCPLTTNVIRGATVLRVHLKASECGLARDSDILVDQVRSIDNRRLMRELGSLPREDRLKLLENLRTLVLE